MIRLKFLGEEHLLDNINGYYRLEDLKGLDPKRFMREEGPHTPYSLQFRKYVWANQAKVYQYCAWADPEFKKSMDEALSTGNIELSPASGVIHK